MSEEKEQNIYKTFVISLGITLLLCLTATFIVISITNRKLIDEQSLVQARAHFRSIVMTRKWNSEHGGVYVEKRRGMKSNPYLENPDITTSDGKVYTKMNPALMTREISEFSEKEGLFSFHITSLRPVNPENKPDEFEKKSLRLFEEGKKEVFETAERDNKTFFRYMAPLYNEEECVQCHAGHGYSLGDVRGGISVFFMIENIKNIQKTNTRVIILLAFFSTSIIMGLTAFFTSRLSKKITEARRKIEVIAVTDDLTGLFNRRQLMLRFEEEFERAKRLKRLLSCIMIDIDNFKSINDEYGHLAGDGILRETSQLIKESIRPYDIVGRYGGEEFLVVLPDTNFEDAKIFAERIRKNIKANLASRSALFHDRVVSISLGVTRLQESDLSVDDIIKRADEGMYRAKSTGRDKVAWT